MNGGLPPDSVGLGDPPDFARVLVDAQRVADDISRRLGLGVDAGTIVSGRAELLGSSPRGRISAGGATRLLAGEDGWCAMTLSRADDVDLIPALTESSGEVLEPWSAVEQWVAHRSVQAVVERAGLLGIPAAVLGETAPSAPLVQKLGHAASTPRNVSGLLVADLSSMWAGPLCGSLLAAAGATVIKVESPSRPDGTRAGPAAFFEWMNAGKLSYAIDFDDDAVQLRQLLTVADVVIEGSRPAALTRRGLGPYDVAPRPGRVWLRITGYGATGPGAQRVAFGDDAAVAGGLVGYADGEPVFRGDAIADPLSGLEATRALLESLSHGGGELICVSMAGVAATYAAGQVTADAAIPPVPRRPPRSGTAPGLGADNSVVERLVIERLHAPC